MLIKEVMSKKQPRCAAPDETLHEAAKEMKDLDIGFLPVCQNDRLIGAVTDRDIAIRAVAEGRDPDKTLVRDVMTKKVYYCFEDQDTDEAATQMEEHKVRRIVVLNRDKRFVGVLSVGDLATAKTRAIAEEVLEKVSH